MNPPQNANFKDLTPSKCEVKMNENDFEKIESMISRHVGTFADSIQHKLDLVVEGHQMLSEKIDRVEERLDGRIDCVVRKLDAVAAQGSITAAKLDAVAAQGSITAARLDAVAAKLDAVAAQGSITAARLDAVAAKLDAVAAQGSITATKLDAVAAQGNATAAKLDALAADLKAHRRDTEAHSPVYRVKE
jgi:hypothetical protein